MLRPLLIVAVVTGCGAADHPAQPAAVALPAGTALAAPPGWVAITPDAERLRCANYATDEWLVSSERGAVHVGLATAREPSSGPPLPFPWPAGDELAGRRHVLAVADGFLVGLDAGEWGGSLHWFSADGARHYRIAGENVHGLVAQGDDQVVSLEGLNHLVIRQGFARWIERRGGTWRETQVVEFEGGPYAFVAAPGAIYAVTSASLVAIHPDRTVAIVQPLAVQGLYPDSMTIDAAGQLWIGMRQLVLRLTPAGARFTPTYFAQASCRRATVSELSCVCSPDAGP